MAAELAPAVAGFLQNATLLYQQAAQAEKHGQGKPVVIDDASRLALEFEALVGRLACHVDFDAAPSDVEPTRRLAKACWKLSQDVLLRLKGPSGAPDRPAAAPRPGGHPDVVSWPVQDVEAFGLRVSDLRSKWAVLRPSQSDNLAGISDSLARLNVLTLDEGPGPEQGLDVSGEEPARKGVPPRMASAGLLNDFILESLSFKSMRNREEEVADAHDKTFDWIFNPPQEVAREAKNDLGDHFTRWLGGDNLGSIYWVTGKPGSGKSTLMRYVSEHPSTVRLLQAWAGRDQLVKANFYFWTSGSEEQRSQTGLLRYLLYQLLSEDMSYIAKVFPQLWQKLARMTTKERIKVTLEWSVENLLAAFRSFLTQALPTKRICLFVDGLDEFDGDHTSIINFFKELAEGPSKDRMKMCLSSRPWEVFEKAFETSVPNLKLQDLTFQDMFHYVHDNLRSVRQLRKLLSQDEGNAELLTQQIVQQADGVFLWVRLVVRKVIERFDNSDASVSDIQSYVRTLPTDLDELFDKLIFYSQSKEDLIESSQVFQLVRAREVVADFIKDESSNSLTIWEFAFALRPEDDGLALQAQVQEISDDELIQRCVSTERRILSRSVGLLEIYSKRDQRRATRFEDPVTSARRLATNRVTYLHRTVRDYLMLTPNVWHRLVSHSVASFDPHLRLLRSHVLRLKHSLEEIEHHRRLDEWYPDIALSLTHTRHIAVDSLRLRTPLVSELDKTMSWLWLARPDDPQDHWARACFGSYEERKGNKIVFPQPFLLLCTKFGLEGYVVDMLDELAKRYQDSSLKFPLFVPEHEEIDDFEESDDESYVESELPVEETPLLKYALEFLTSRQKMIFPLSSPSFVLALLNSPHREHPVLGAFVGAPGTVFTSPLTKRKEVTPWLMTLRHLRDAKRRGWIEPFDIDPSGTERWVKIVKSLIDTGEASLEAVLAFDGWDPEASARDVLAGPTQLGAVQDWWVRGLAESVGRP